MDGGTVRAGAGTAAPAEPDRQGIVLDDWLEEPVPPAAGARGRSGFAGRSPLTRRIISFNILALAALVAGILYVNQFEDVVIAERERGVAAEARVIAQAVARIASPEFGDPAPERAAANRAEARAFLDALAHASPNRVQIFDREGRLIADTIDAPGRVVQRAMVEAPAPDRGILGEAIWRIEGLFSDLAPVYSERLTPGISADPKVARALEGRLAATRAPDASGRMIVGVGLPAARGRSVLAAVVVSTWPGEIDRVSSARRAQLMQVFGVAIIISVLLSVVLANTIARPIRRLAEAAEQGQGRTSRLLNPERIRIPDLTARPDEIGYLSGAMRQMTAALYDRIEQSEVFAAEVAHEIKNPLTSLRSAVETLRLTRSDQARERLLAVIEKDVTRLDRLVTDISNASRLDSEMVREEMETFSMTELLSNLVEFNAPKARQAGAALLADLPEDPLFTSGLEGRLAQVFVNLIANAISFTGEGGAILVAAERLAEGGVRVSVSDSGPGIPDENLADIFKRFYSERPKGDFGKHSGLGLSISKQIVDAHGGRIWAENVREPGAGPQAPRKGARFIVELPR
jgi:two-component system sensor histidine kinase ChvG